MVRMSHPQHGFAMVSGLERPAFDAAGWTVEDADPVQVQAEPEPEQPKKRGRPRKVTSDADSV